MVAKNRLKTWCPRVNETGTFIKTNKRGLLNKDFQAYTEMIYSNVSHTKNPVICIAKCFYKTRATRFD